MNYTCRAAKSGFRMGGLLNRGHESIHNIVLNTSQFRLGKVVFLLGTSRLIKIYIGFYTSESLGNWVYKHQSLGQVGC